MTQRVAYTAAMIPAQRLIGIAVWMQRTAAFILLVASTVGNYVQFNGGWERFRAADARTAQAALIAILYQLLFSTGQFAFLHFRARWWYLGSLLGSVIPSFLAYYALTGGYFTTWFVQHGLASGAWVASGIIVFIAALGADFLPERILVR